MDTTEVDLPSPRVPHVRLPGGSDEYNATNNTMRGMPAPPQPHLSSSSSSFGIRDPHAPPHQSHKSTINVKQVYVHILITALSILILSLVLFVWYRGKPSDCTGNSGAAVIYSGASYDIGQPPVLPQDGYPWTTFTVLHMNDVYELLPLNGRGGLPKVATVRKMLIAEGQQANEIPTNRHVGVVSVLGGDLISPSALGTVKLTTVDNKPMGGRQMVAVMNTLGLNVATFGNHEFDLGKEVLIARMQESQFQWTCANAWDLSTNLTIGNSFSYVIYNMQGLRILFIGLVIDANVGAPPFAEITSIVNDPSIISSLLSTIPRSSYDICFGLTHLDVESDGTLAEEVAQLDAIFGGHVHTDSFLQRGTTHTPIYRADGNTFSVYIHRVAYSNTPSRRILIHSTLTWITSEFDDDPATLNVSNYWFNLGMAEFTKQGFDPEAPVGYLPFGTVFDGRSETVRTMPTLFSTEICKSYLAATQNVTNPLLTPPTVGIFNSGAIRIDDIIEGPYTMNQYDVLRTLPFVNNLYAALFTADVLNMAIVHGLSIPGDGMYAVICGDVQKNAQGQYTDGQGIPYAGSDRNISVVSIEYYFLHTAFATQFKGSAPKELFERDAKALIPYLKIHYPVPPPLRIGEGQEEPQEFEL